MQKTKFDASFQKVPIAFFPAITRRPAAVKSIDRVEHKEQ